MANIYKKPKCWGFTIFLFNLVRNIGREFRKISYLDYQVYSSYGKLYFVEKIKRFEKRLSSKILICSRYGTTTIGRVSIVMYTTSKITALF